jgi:hypothetical protein
MGQHVLYYSDRTKLERNKDIDVFSDNLDEAISLLTITSNVLREHAYSETNGHLLDGLSEVTTRLTEIKEKNQDDDGEVLEYVGIFYTTKRHEDGTYIDDVYLFSLEETMKFINEGHCGFKNSGEFVYLPSDSEQGQYIFSKLKEFWDTYPNGYITFG